MKNKIQGAEVEVVANLCTTPSSFRKILKMNVGDILPLDISETVELKVDDVTIMECSYGQINGQYALSIEKLIHNTNELL
jgi:flagellar motor switch protein FliM